jgi:hypothetical protein
VVGLHRRVREPVSHAGLQHGGRRLRVGWVGRYRNRMTVSRVFFDLSGFQSIIVQFNLLSRLRLQKPAF